MTLQKKANLVVAVIIFFTLGITTAVLTYVATDKYRTAILSKSASAGDALKRDLGKVLSLGIPLASLSGVDEKLAALVSGDEAVGYALIMDRTGTVLFHNDQTKKGGRIDASSLQKSSSDSKTTTIRSEDSFYALSLPLLDANDDRIGTLRIGVKSAAINKQIIVLLLWALCIGFLSFVLSLGLMYFSIAKFITGPILNMEKASEKIASGDLTNTITLRGEDEIAELGNAINRITSNLKNMLIKIGNITGSVSAVTSNIVSASEGILKIADIQKKALDETTASNDSLDASISSVAQSAENLSESSDNTSSSILEMTKSIEMVAESAKLFDGAAQESSASIEEMLTNIKQIAESLNNLSSSSDSIATSIDEVNSTVKEIEKRANESVTLAEQVTVQASDKGIGAINAAMAGMNDIRDSVSSLTTAINVLGKRSEDIGKILNVINEVTDQTNLLSLNAAILSAQAGEHGKSFSVVADHIRSLAEKTAASTKEIAALISSVQEETHTSIQLASEGLKTVEKGLGLVRDVNNALLGIVDRSQSSTEMSKAIQRATAEQSIVIRQITESAKDMSLQIEKISLALQEQNKGSKFILDITEKMKNLSHQVKTSTEEQRIGSLQISKSSENITVQAEQIAESTKKQKDESIEIVKSMEKVKNTTSNLIQSAHDMSSTVESLQEEARNLLAELKKFKVS
ncbi:MAG: methyl-accepting chemotaxis protein [bacterium]